jgi:hypothetical protein
MEGIIGVSILMAMVWVAYEMWWLKGGIIALIILGVLVAIALQK